MSNPAVQPFGKYQILERIATGGMAEIYKARLEGIGGFQRTFAIKRILPNLSQNSEYIAMLVDEAKVAGLLSHANIVQILDLGQVDSIWYIAMEYVHGRDLGAVLRRAKKKGLNLPVPHTVFVAIELLKGLEYAHQRQVMRGGRPVALNIIHRDVSPPNVLLSFQGEVKLTDFGIARASLKAMETVSGIVKGRFDYMSPEQAAGAKDLDQRSDLFSVGVVLYEMLTGHHPFRTDNEIGTIERVRSGRYTPVSQRNSEVPFTLETIVDRALQVNREDRYPSATAFKEALDKFFHDAGFIFTHATLASYVKGLFPEATAKPGQKAAAATPTNPNTGKVVRPGSTPVPPDNSEGPTRRLDRRRLAELRPEDQADPDRGSTPSAGNPPTGPTRSETSQSIPTLTAAAQPRSQHTSNPPTPVSAPKMARPFTPPSTGTPVTLAGTTGNPLQAVRTNSPGASGAGASGAGVGGAGLGAGGNGPPSGPVHAQSPVPLTTGTPKPLSDFLSGDDSETLIRKMPAGFEEEVATQLRSLASISSGPVGIPANVPDQQTVLRAVSTGADPVVREIEAEERSASGARKKKKPRTTAPPQTSSGIVPVAASVVTLLLGLFVGAAVAVLGTLALGGGNPPAAPVVVTPTQIEVVAPTGTQILLDGDAVSHKVAVSPNELHRLVVTLRDHEPWTTELKLQPGESRVIIVTAVQSRAVQQAPTGQAPPRPKPNR